MVTFKMCINLRNNSKNLAQSDPGVTKFTLRHRLNFNVVRTLSVRKLIKLSEIQIKTSFPLVFCSLICIFATMFKQ